MLLVHLLVIIRRDLFTFYFYNQIKNLRLCLQPLLGVWTPWAWAVPFPWAVWGSLCSFLLFSSFWLLLNSLCEGWTLASLPARRCLHRARTASQFQAHGLFGVVQGAKNWLASQFFTSDGFPWRGTSLSVVHGINAYEHPFSHSFRKYFLRAPCGILYF